MRNVITVISVPKETFMLEEACSGDFSSRGIRENRLFIVGSPAFGVRHISSYPEGVYIMKDNIIRQDICSVIP